MRECRKTAGYSQERLAEAAGLDRSFISLVERGIQSPNIVVLLRIAEVLGVAASELIAQTECALQTTSGEKDAIAAPAKVRKPRDH